MTTGSPAAGAPRTGLAAFKDGARNVAHRLLHPVTSLLISAGIGADALTTIGCILGLAAGVSFFEGHFRAATVMLLVGGLCDILDGEVARMQQRVSRFGAFLDSTLDRFSEAFVLVGIAGYYMFHLLELVRDPTNVLTEISHGLEPATWVRVALLALLALLGSFLVSYTRARAEGLGLECKVGWFERPERLLLIMIAGAFGVGPVMPGALLLLMILSFTTAGQRVVHVWKHTRTR